MTPRPREHAAPPDAVPPSAGSRARRLLAALCLAVMSCIAVVPAAMASDALPPTERWRPARPGGSVGALILLSTSGPATAPEQETIARGLAAEVARQGGHAMLLSGLPPAPPEAALVVIDRLAGALLDDIDSASGAGGGRLVVISIGALSDTLLRRRLSGTEPATMAGVPMLLVDPGCAGADPAAAPSGLTLLRQNFYDAGRHPETRDCQRLDRDLRNRGLAARFQHAWEGQRPRRGREQGHELDVRALTNAVTR